MRKLWINLRSSLWFVPMVLLLSAMSLAFGLVEADVLFADRLKPWGWLPFLKAGSAGARGMLEAIAGSMITVAGLAFSITIVTLSLASTQYTPRILRNFMRDRANQSVLGVFVGIYAYCLVVLRTIRDSNDAGGGFVPLMAVSFGVLLALVGIGYLIFFIHHIASSIQAPTILDSITKETLRAIDRLFPQDIGVPAKDEPAAKETVQEKKWHRITAQSTGYIQSVDDDALWKVATDEKLILRLDKEIGEFVVAGESTISSSRQLDDETLGKVRQFFVIGNFRTVDQDVGFGIRQIVDIALKALSPGINGTTTAVACLEYLSAILSQLAQRPMVSPYRKADGNLFVVAPAPRFADFVAKSLDEIRLCAADNVSIYLALLSLLTRVAGATMDADRRSVLLLHARLILDLAGASISAEYDRARVNDQVEKLQEVLEVTQQLPKLTTSSLT